MAWKCYHGCGREISDEFYQEIVKAAGHPPVCECRYSMNGFFNQPWSLWERIDTLAERLKDRKVPEDCPDDTIAPALHEEPHGIPLD